MVGAQEIVLSAGNCTKKGRKKKNMIKTKDKPKEDIYWLDSEQYAKALYQLRVNIYNILDTTFNIYGLGAYISGATDATVKLAEDFALRCRGADKPIGVEYSDPKGMRKK